VTARTGLGSGARSALVFVTMAIGAFVSVMTVLGFFGSSWWVFDFFANYRWQLMWIAIACAVVYALSAQGLAAIVFIAAAVVNGFVVSPLWFGSQPEGTGEDGITVVSLDMDGSTTDEDVVLNWLFDTDADVIIVSGVAGDRLLPLVVDGSPYVPIIGPPESRTGVAVIGKEAYTAERRETDDGQPIYLIRVPAGDDTITILTAWSEVARNSAAWTEVNARVEAIAEVVRTRTTPITVIGPLGATRFSSPMRNLLGTTGLRDATEGYGYLSTTPVSNIPVIGGWIGIPLDIVFMTPDITPLELETGPDVGVGHLPVTVTIGPAATN
jgi:endonuclease/exonuclease/phosphatase (EEP) superfamily protein YafD